MRVLMLGWEFPPFISGGLGTACRGLTDALARTDVQVLFVLPRSIESAAADEADLAAARGHVRLSARRAERLRIAALPSAITSPYGAGSSDARDMAGDAHAARRRSVRVLGVGAEDGYEGDLVGKIQAYAERCVELARHELFDVIHAHDWMTFPAAMSIARLSGRPMVVHVHATEFDRSSDPTSGTICEIERRGMHAAARVLAVSNRTRKTIVDRYGVPGSRVKVVHNGIEPPRDGLARPDGSTVLFIGRITRQKGPSFFVRAAARVAARVPDARFVVAGTGDQLAATRALAHELGILDRIEFPGFLRGDDVDHAYRRAAVYVMPSVSEPFGLTALEAAARGVPVILSRTSGAAEVLRRGSLQVDYWDVELMARMIVAVLTNRRLARGLVEQSRNEIAGATWESAARCCVQHYHEVTANASRARSTVDAGAGVVSPAGCEEMSAA